MTTPPEPPPSDDGTEPADSSVSEETWRKFSEDTYSLIRASAAPKELSARAREVAARLRRQDAEAQAQREARASRFGRKGRRLGEPRGRRTGPPRQETRRDERSVWRRLQTPLIVTAVAIAVVISLDPSRALSMVRGGGTSTAHGSEAAATTLPPETATPTAAPSARSAPSDSAIATLRRPFAGSPAEQWADGTAGIVLPQARAVGALPRQKVLAALRATERYLVATSLDPATLSGRYPQEAIDLIDPRDSYTRDGMRTALRSPGRHDDPLGWFTRYQPAKLALVGDVIKVRGEITFAKGPNGSVKVHADYTFVYPFRLVHDDSGEVSRSIVRRVLDFEADGPELWLSRDAYEIGNDACGVYDGYLHPGFAADEPSAGPATGPTIDPYDRSRPIGGTGRGCAVDSRT